ncbi:MAG: Fe-S cluster assembly protein SufD, partial [Alcaligenaceae bacterium]|nr:Fe-S cluster assembly protein SufD [Alcaligenaceae bacterium]
MSSVQPWLADFSARHQQLPGADLPWLAVMRQRAIDRFAAEGWPTPKKEDWRHTSLALLEQAAFNTQAESQDVSEQVRALKAGEAG